MAVIRIENEREFDELLNGSKTLLVDFYADWCPPCKMIAPLIEEVSAENENIKFVKISE